MKANEFRIGNLIHVKTIVESAKVMSITPRFFSSLAGGRSFEDQANNLELAEHYLPIPLTEEWLLKFGFERSVAKRNSNIFTLMGEGISIFKEKGYWYSTFTQRSSIKHVHQLQNLYFTLTGEELVLTSPPPTSPE